jgi:hypothetical protein
VQRQFGRRTLLRGGFGAVAMGGLAACSTEGDFVSEGVSAGPESTLTALFPRDVAYTPAATPFRLTYTLTDAEGIPMRELDGPFSFTVSFDGEPIGDPVEVVPHDDGVPRPYLPLPVEFPRPGIYDVETEHDGRRLNSQVQVFAAEEIQQPLVGQDLPPVPTPTTTEAFEVNPICTLNPQCPFHEHDLRDVVGQGTPVAVLLASPAYCATTVCGPILDLLVDDAAGREGLLTIHSEVYRNPKGVRDLSEALLAPLPMDYDMTFEPCLFVADGEGRIVARGDIVVDRVEMAQMLDLVS